MSFSLCPSLSLSPSPYLPLSVCVLATRSGMMRRAFDQGLEIRRESLSLGSALRVRGMRRCTRDLGLDLPALGRSRGARGMGLTPPTLETRGGAHIKEEARGSRLGPDCTGNKTRGLELRLRPARTGNAAMANRIGVGSARIGDEPRGLGHGPGPARIGDKRRGPGLGFALALLVLRIRRRALGACVLPYGPPACSSHFNVQEC